MTKAIQLVARIPFEGFYCSKYSDEIDQQEAQWAEYEANERDEGEASHPEALRLSEAELADLLMRHTSYDIAYRRVANWYAEAFSREASDRIGFDLGLTFESMSSPREYNFTTDRLFAFLPLKSARAMFKLSKAEGHASLSRQIRESFTSRDGFSSFYSNDIADWLAKPLTDWDHNELCSLIEACLQMSGDHSEDFDWAVYYATVGDEGGYQAWSDAVDWPAFEKACEEARADKLADLADLDPETAKQLGYDFEWRTSNVVRHPDQAPLI